MQILPAEVLWAAPVHGSERHAIVISILNLPIVQPRLVVSLVTRFNVPGVGIFTTMDTDDELLNDFEIPAALADRKGLGDLPRLRGLNFLWGAVSKSDLDHYMVFSRTWERDDNWFNFQGRICRLRATRSAKLWFLSLV